MSKEQEIQDGLEKYWGQLDRIEESTIFLRNQINRFDKVERMLKWLVVKRLDDERYFYSLDGRTYHYSRLQKMIPDISDILDDVEKK